MKKIFLLAIAITINTLCCNAQLFWEISGNGLEKPSYVFGTHHIAPISILDSIPGFEEALSSVDKVYGEMIMSEAQSAESQQKMATYIIAPQDSTLTAVLTATQADSLDKMLKHYMGETVSVSQFDALKPAIIGTMLGLAQSQAAFPDFNFQQQLDSEIQNRAASKGKEIGGFETIDDQCKAMFGASILSQAKDLMEMVHKKDSAESTAIKLAKAYLAGDLNTMLEIMENPTLGGSSEWAEEMIYQRNANWMRIIASLLPTASIFIAVGAGHLPGDKGLLNLLRKEGYTVKPIEK